MGSGYRVEVSVKDIPQASLVMRNSQRWLVRIRSTADSPVLAERAVHGGSSSVQLAVDQPGTYQVELVVAFGRYAAMALPGFSGVDAVFERVLGVPLSAAFESIADSGEARVSADAPPPVPVVLDATQRGTDRAPRIAAAAVDAVLVIGVLFGLGYVLLELARSGLDYRVLLGVGSFVALVGVVLSFNAFFAAVGSLRRGRAVGSQVEVVDKFELGVAVAADALIGLFFIWALSAGMVMILGALQTEWGLCLTSSGCRALSPGKLQEGLLWHGADTVPLVDIPKAWGWDEPWKIQANPPVSVVAGFFPFLVRLVVALGLARFVTQLLEKPTPGATGG